MNNFIERYVYDVIRRLPENIREDVKKELYANIQDMLPETPSENDIFEVLKSLGDPAKLAEQYRSRPRYLISPAFFDEYIRTLKLITLIVGTVVICLGIISSITESTSSDSLITVFTDILVNVLVDAFTAVSNAFLWVTLSFAIVDYFNIKQNKQKEWSPLSLPQLPSPVPARISRGEAITNMVFSTLFTILFLRYPHLFSWYDIADGVHVVPFFNDTVIARFAPIFIFILVLSLILGAIKLIYGRWNFILADLNGIYNIISASVSIAFITAPNFISNDFLERAAHALSIDVMKISSYFELGLRVSILLIVLFTTIDIISNFYKAYKNHMVQR